MDCLMNALGLTPPRWVRVGWRVGSRDGALPQTHCFPYESAAGRNCGEIP